MKKKQDEGGGGEGGGGGRTKKKEGKEEEEEPPKSMSILKAAFHSFFINHLTSLSDLSREPFGFFGRRISRLLTSANLPTCVRFFFFLRRRRKIQYLNRICIPRGNHSVC